MHRIRIFLPLLFALAILAGCSSDAQTNSSAEKVSQSSPAREQRTDLSGEEAKERLESMYGIEVYAGAQLMKPGDYLLNILGRNTDILLLSNLFFLPEENSLTEIHIYLEDKAYTYPIVSSSSRGSLIKINLESLEKLDQSRLKKIVRLNLVKAENLIEAIKSVNIYAEKNGKYESFLIGYSLGEHNIILYELPIADTGSVSHLVEFVFENESRYTKFTLGQKNSLIQEVDIAMDKLNGLDQYLENISTPDQTNSDTNGTVTAFPAEESKLLRLKFPDLKENDQYRLAIYHPAGFPLVTTAAGPYRIANQMEYTVPKDSAEYDLYLMVNDEYYEFSAIAYQEAEISLTLSNSKKINQAKFEGVFSSVGNNQDDQPSAGGRQLRLRLPDAVDGDIYRLVAVSGGKPIINSSLMSHNTVRDGDGISFPISEIVDQYDIYLKLNDEYYYFPDIPHRETTIDLAIKSAKKISAEEFETQPK